MLGEKCRVCHQLLFDSAVLEYSNMPKSAQFLPDDRELKDDIGVNLSVCQCSGCGLVQLSNAPVFYYKEVIRAAAVSEVMTAFRQEEFKQWIDKYQLQGKKLIEIGCGAGEFLDIMRLNNINVYGIEQGTASIKKCLSKGLEVEQGFIDSDEKQLKHYPFDAFYMLNFLEHLPDPNTVLKGVANNLVDGAIGLVEVPNFDMILRNNLFSEFISDHLFYFTKETFIATLTRNGFEVIECNEVWHEYSISAVVRKRAKIDLSIFKRYQDKLGGELHCYINQFPDNSVAIWGAGHQALAVMSLTDMGGKIKYVIDSASFKQNKYTPATHIPIVHPNKIKEDPVKAVIVMAASYSTEVVTILQNEYSKEIKIAILDENGLKESEL